MNPLYQQLFPRPPPAPTASTFQAFCASLTNSPTISHTPDGHPTPAAILSAARLHFPNETHRAAFHTWYTAQQQQQAARRLRAPATRHSSEDLVAQLDALSISTARHDEPLTTPLRIPANTAALAARHRDDLVAQLDALSAPADLDALWAAMTRDPVPTVPLGRASGAALRLVPDAFALCAERWVLGLSPEWGVGAGFVVATVGRVEYRSKEEERGWRRTGFVLVRRVDGGFYLVAEVTGENVAALRRGPVRWEGGVGVRAGEVVVGRVETEEYVADWAEFEVLEERVVLFSAEVVMVERGADGGFVCVE